MPYDTAVKPNKMSKSKTKTFTESKRKKTDGMAEKEKNFNEAYNHAISVWSPWLAEAKTDLKFYLLDQWSAQDKKYLRSQDRNAFVFDKIRRVVHAIGGYQKKNRLSLKAIASGGASEETADVFSALIMNTFTKNKLYHLLSKAFSNGSLKTGINLIHPYIDFSRDPLNGDIRYSRLPYNKFLLDPNFQDIDLNNKSCSFLLRREWLTKDMAKMILPDFKNEIESMHPKGRDNKYVFSYPHRDLLGKSKLAYDEMWNSTTKKCKFLVNTRTGATRYWRDGDESLRMFLQLFPETAVIDKMEETVEVNIYLDGKCFYTGSDPNGIDMFPFVPFIGYYDEEYEEMKWKLQGIVRCMRDPQTEANKRRSKLVDMMDTAITTGYISEEGAVVDPDELYKTGSSKVVVTREGAVSEQRIRELKAPEIPQGYFLASEMFDKDVLNAPGATSELIGEAEKGVEIAAILGKMRLGQGLTSFQDIFDNYRESKQRVGEITMRLGQENYSPDKIRKVTEKEPTDEFYNREFLDYGLETEEGVLTSFQKQMAYLELKALKLEGYNIPISIILQYAPIQNKKELIKHMEAEEKMMKSQQMRVMEQEALLKFIMQAKGVSDIASAESKRAKATEDRASAMLKKIQMLSEIADTTEGRLMKALEFSRNFEKDITPKETMARR